MLGCEQERDMFHAEQEEAVSQLKIVTRRIVNEYCRDAEINGPAAYAVAHDRAGTHPNRNILASAAKTSLRVYEINKKALVENASNTEYFFCRSRSGRDDYIYGIGLRVASSVHGLGYAVLADPDGGQFLIAEVIEIERGNNLRASLAQW